MKSNQPSADAARAMGRVLDLIIDLRAPDGCPWDREQTPKSAARYLIEEAFEAVDAIESSDLEEACSELGDVIFQAAFIAQIYADQGDFSLADALDTVHAKMVRRHPHVFGESKVADSEAVLEQWDRIKRRESKPEGQGLLDSVPKAAPALVRAQRLGHKASRVGFDWQRADQVWDKILEEMQELKQAENPEQAQAELGDVLFAWTQWARHRGLDLGNRLKGIGFQIPKTLQDDGGRGPGDGPQSGTNWMTPVWMSFGSGQSWSAGPPY